MLPEQDADQHRSAFTPPCANCGSNYAEPDSPSKLCASCREQFIRFPVPLWIKGFGLGIALLLVLALTRLPSQLSMGVSLERGKAAIEARNYFTAQEHLGEFVMTVPESEEGQCNLLIACFYNEDFENFVKVYSRLEGKEVKDEKLYTEVQSVLNLADHYYPTDSFQVLLDRYNNDATAVPDTAYEHFLGGRANELYATMCYVGRLVDEKQYGKCDSLLKRTLKVYEDFVPAYTGLANLKRLEDSLELSLKYCDKALALNHEYVDALCSKSRTLVKMKRDAEALALAKQALSINSISPYTQSTAALAYHFNNNTKERDALLQQAFQTDSSAGGYAQHVLDVVSGKEKYR